MQTLSSHLSVAMQSKQFLSKGFLPLATLEAMVVSRTHLRHVSAGASAPLAAIAAEFAAKKHERVVAQLEAKRCYRSLEWQHGNTEGKTHRRGEFPKRHWKPFSTPGFCCNVLYRAAEGSRSFGTFRTHTIVLSSQCLTTRFRVALSGSQLPTHPVLLLRHVSAGASAPAFAAVFAANTETKE